LSGLWPTIHVAKEMGQRLGASEVLRREMSASREKGCEQMSVGSATVEDFERLDIRVGKVVEVTPFPEGRYSTHVLLVDFGSELGSRKSLAKLAPNYAASDILGRQVLCIVNFLPRQIGKHQSEVLTLGVPDENGNVVLLRPDTDVPLGGKLY
jgi:tRNA-binding protein